MTRILALRRRAALASRVMEETPIQNLRTTYLLLLTAARGDREGANHLVETHREPQVLLAALCGITEQLGHRVFDSDEGWIRYLEHAVERLDVR